MLEHWSKEAGSSLVPSCPMNGSPTLDMNPEFSISVSSWLWNERVPGAVGPNRIESGVAKNAMPCDCIGDPYLRRNLVSNDLSRVNRFSSLVSSFLRFH